MAGCHSAADNTVVLCRPARRGRRFHANGPRHLALAYDHVFELFRRTQAALRKHRIVNCWFARGWFTPHLTSRIDRVLRCTALTMSVTGDA